MISLGGRRKKFHGRTRAEVAAKLNATLKAKGEGLPLPAERETLAHFLETWLRDTMKQSVRPATYTSYASIVRHHLISAWGARR